MERPINSRWSFEFEGYMVDMEDLLPYILKDIHEDADKADDILDSADPYAELMEYINDREFTDYIREYYGIPEPEPDEDPDAIDKAYDDYIEDKLEGNL